MGIFEIIIILVVALIVIPPENLPDVMRATGKILRELRLASNMVMRELGGAIDQPPEGDRGVPPINTMKPAAPANGGSTIAQAPPSADSASLPPAAASGSPSATSPASASPVPNGPKAAD